MAGKDKNPPSGNKPINYDPVADFLLKAMDKMRTGEGVNVDAAVSTIKESADHIFRFLAAGDNTVTSREYLAALQKIDPQILEKVDPKAAKVLKDPSGSFTKNQWDEKVIKPFIEFIEGMDKKDRNGKSDGVITASELSIPVKGNEQFYSVVMQGFKQAHPNNPGIQALPDRLKDLDIMRDGVVGSVDIAVAVNNVNMTNAANIAKADNNSASKARNR